MYNLVSIEKVLEQTHLFEDFIFVYINANYALQDAIHALTASLASAAALPCTANPFVTRAPGAAF